jgi:hypothetical protein
MQTPAPGAMLRQEKRPIGTAPQAIQQVGEVFVITRPIPEDDGTHHAKPRSRKHVPWDLASVRPQTLRYHFG